MQPAQEAGYAQQTWCRPLTGCATSLPHSASSGASGAAAPPPLPPMVALGKFDALHKGHRALAAAAAGMGGAPWLVSFSGIAEVLGWPERLPLVAPCDRRRVLAAWAPHCEGRAPQECAIPFAEVRTMSPEAFVELLAEELEVAGVVVGANYRFGYRAAGTAALLQQLGPQHGMRVQVLDLVAGSTPAAAVAAGEEQQRHGQQQHAQQQQAQQQAEQQQPLAADQRAADRQAAHEAVSSSRVRHALGLGDMADAALCLDRPYRLVASLAEAAPSVLPDGPALRLPAAALLNQPPRPGRYAVLAGVAGGETLQQLVAPQPAQLGVDECGITLHGGGALLAALPPGAQHLTLDFV